MNVIKVLRQTDKVFFIYYILISFFREKYKFYNFFMLFKTTIFFVQSKHVFLRLKIIKIIFKEAAFIFLD